MTGNYELPAGCIFVLHPKNEQEVESSECLLIGNVNFKENPDRLFAIITTPENVELVKEWGRASNVDSNKVHDYENFKNLFDRDESMRR